MLKIVNDLDGGARCGGKTCEPGSQNGNSGFIAAWNKRAGSIVIPPVGVPLDKRRPFWFVYIGE
jgi:hypothetical protein